MIWVLGNQFTFMIVTASRGHVIAILYLPSQLLASKINGEPHDSLNDHVVHLTPAVIHLTTAAKQVVKSGRICLMTLRLATEILGPIVVIKQGLPVGLLI